MPDFIINGMKILGQYHEPTFYYESLWNIDGFIILLLLRHNKKIKLVNSFQDESIEVGEL